jgi:hypothetical protein
MMCAPQWNEMVEGLATPGTQPLRIEDLNPRLLVAALNLPNSSVAFDAQKLGSFPGLSRVPESLAIHASAAADSVARVRLDWAALQAALGPPLSARLWAAAARYGYTDLAQPVAATAADFYEETRHGREKSSVPGLKPRRGGPGRGGGPRAMEE